MNIENLLQKKIDLLIWSFFFFFTNFSMFEVVQNKFFQKQLINKKPSNQVSGPVVTEIKNSVNYNRKFMKILPIAHLIN